MSRGQQDEDKQNRQAQALIKGLEHFETDVRGYAKDGIDITGFSVRMPQHEHGDYFMVIRAETEGSKMVAFRDGEDLVGLLRGLFRAMKGDTIKWREDNYE